MKVLRNRTIKKECIKVKELVDVPVSLAMRYGNLLFVRVTRLHDQGVTEVMLFPLYRNMLWHLQQQY
jgi:protoheme ferro-lyase